jgi:serine/threonine protein kinase
MQAAHECSLIGDLGFSEKCIVHGDLTPGNIIVGSDAAPVVIDFMMPDIQRMPLQDVRTYSYWRKNAGAQYSYHPPMTGAFGTPGFMSPEQELEGIVTPASDIYTLGKTLTYLFWPNNSRDMSQYNALLAARSPASSLEARMAKLVLTMVSPQPKDRPPSMRSVAESLDELHSRAGCVPASTSGESGRVLSDTTGTEQSATTQRRWWQFWK